jgi:hypothetical protein
MGAPRFMNMEPLRYSPTIEIIFAGLGSQVERRTNRCT